MSSSDIYADIPGYPGYKLTPDFQIIGKKGKPLTLCGDLYKFVNVMKEGKGQDVLYLHRAIALVYVEGYFDGAFVDHIDDNPLNNSPENLRWVTPHQNQYHAKKFSKQKLKEKISKLQARIKADQAKIIKYQALLNQSFK